MSWIYWVVIIGFMFLMLFLMNRRNKRQAKMMEDTINALQVGDRVVTHIGIFGRIKKIYETTAGKMCVLEIGTNEKIDVEMDIRYILGKDEKTLIPPSETQNVNKEPEVKKEETSKEKQKTKNNKK